MIIKIEVLLTKQNLGASKRFISVFDFLKEDRFGHMMILSFNPRASFPFFVLLVAPISLGGCLGQMCLCSSIDSETNERHQKVNEVFRLLMHLHVRGRIRPSITSITDRMRVTIRFIRRTLTARSATNGPLFRIDASGLIGHARAHFPAGTGTNFLVTSPTRSI